METRANYILVGIVTMAVLFGSFAFVYWIARGTSSQNLTTLEIRIPGSVNGLVNGSAVFYNGIREGTVRGMELDPENPDVVIVTAEVQMDTPVTSKTTASLGFQGLTGQAFIELKGGDPAGVNLLSAAAEKGETARIEADPGAVNNLIEQAQRISERADKILGSLEKFVNDNQEPLTKTIANARDFSDALSKNSKNIDAFLVNVGALSKTLGTVSAKLDSTLTAAEDLLKSVDRAKVNKVLTNAAQVSDDLAASSGDIKTLVESSRDSLKKFGDFTTTASTAVTSVNTLVASVDRTKITATIDNIGAASKTARTAIDDLAKVSGRIGARGDDIDAIIANVKDLSGRLNQSSVRLDGVLAKVDGFLGSSDGQGPGLAEEARSTLIAFRKVADTLNSRLGEITNGLAKFSGRGLSDVQSAVQESRRAISRIETSISNLERDPQRLIFGGTDSVPRSDGRNRR